MAVRIVALLIPLAIVLPQLQTSRPGAVMPEERAALAQPVPPTEWSYATRRVGDAALTRVVLESPAQDALRTIGSAPGSDAAELAPVQPAARKAAPQRAAAKPATRLVRSAKPVITATASMRRATRHAKAPPLDAGCEPFAHCAPVVMGKVTPVSRKIAVTPHEVTPVSRKSL